jgi:hypothetical protein
MGSDAGQLGYPLDGPGHVQRNGPVCRICHPRVQVAEYERRSFDAHQVRDRQPGFCYLIAQLTGPMAKAVKPSSCSGGSIPVMSIRSMRS